MQAIPTGGILVLVRRLVALALKHTEPACKEMRSKFFVFRAVSESGSTLNTLARQWHYNSSEVSHGLERDE